MSLSRKLSDYPIEQIISTNYIDYPLAIETMQTRVLSMREGKSGGLLWFLEHPSLYTAGTSAKDTDLLSNFKFPVYEAGRGGKYTYHGPGQLVVYCMIDLRVASLDARQYVKALEHWVLDVLRMYGIEGALYPDRIGVWVTHPGTKKESKIAAIGVRITHGITWHGLSFNITTNLTHYQGIIPCGISDFGVTSLLEQGITASLNDVICAFSATIPASFLEKIPKTADY